MTFRLLVFLASLIVSGVVRAGNFIIEDTHPPLPPQVENVLRVSGQLGDCKAIGRAVDLEGKGRNLDYVATTANVCGWGAAKGPIWVLRFTQAGYVVVLSETGYQLSLGKPKARGLRDIVIDVATASWRESGTWAFRKDHYVPARVR